MQIMPIRIVIAWIEEKIMANKKVMEINYPQDLLDAVNSNIRRISFLLLGLAALLTLISFALINNTIRLTIYSKRFFNSYHETGRSELGIYSETFLGSEYMDWCIGGCNG